jgi:hypothetical protein
MGVRYAFWQRLGRQAFHSEYKLPRIATGNGVGDGVTTFCLDIATRIAEVGTAALFHPAWVAEAVSIIRILMNDTVIMATLVQLPNIPVEHEWHTTDRIRLSGFHFLFDYLRIITT